ncbi:MAG: hypothetical protein ABSG77_00150 [Candidatus Acidiferrum sp.]|jgi:hypothetical protein
MEITDKTMQTLGVTCNPRNPLEGLGAHTFKLAWADEKSTYSPRPLIDFKSRLKRTAEGEML